jgi:hypothetical protein
MKNRSEFVARLAGLILGAILILLALQIMAVEADFSFEATAGAVMYAGVGASLVGVVLREQVIRARAPEWQWPAAELGC